MRIPRYQDLVCWQLSVEIRDRVVAIAAGWERARAGRFCEQLCAAARSAPANIAEGFGRSDAVFRRHLDIAIGSLHELETHLGEARKTSALTADEFDELVTLIKRAVVSSTRLAAYLRRSRRT